MQIKYGDKGMEVNIIHWEERGTREERNEGEGKGHRRIRGEANTIHPIHIG